MHTATAASSARAGLAELDDTATIHTIDPATGRPTILVAHTRDLLWTIRRAGRPTDTWVITHAGMYGAVWRVSLDTARASIANGAALAELQEQARAALLARTAA